MDKQRHGSLRNGLAVAGFAALAGCSAGTGLNAVGPASPNALAVRRSVGTTYPTKQSLLFESNFSDEAVNVYRAKSLAKNPLPVATIALPQGGCPYGLAPDKDGNLYVADDCLNQVEIYPKGSTTLKGTITDGITLPKGVAIDKSQTLYVSCTPAAIEEYAKGSTSPTKEVTGGGMSFPSGLSLDKSGNLYIADYGSGAVFELPAGASSVTNLGLQQLNEPLQTAVDQKREHLWVTNGAGNTVNIYLLAGSRSPIETITGNGFPYSVAIQNQGKGRGTAVYGDGSSDSVYAFKPGSYTPYATLNNEVGYPTGLLIAKP